MSVRITTLCDNSTQRMGLLAEHGLSILVEAGDCRVLLDAGQTGVAVHNARALGVDLSRVDAVVLSHGHYDHTGGLPSVLREVGRGGRAVDVLCHPDVFGPHYAVRRDEPARYVGIPYVQRALESEGAAFRFRSGPTVVSERALLTGEVPRLTTFERVDAGLKVPDGEAWAADPILDDQALVVRTGEGLVVVLGCAHSGMINTLEHARRIAGESRVLAVVGGTHLGPASAEQLEETVRALRSYGIARLGVSHCTGPKSAARLAREFGDGFFFNVAGNVVELP